MPIYAYRCGTCGHAQDVLQKISDPLLTVCPACGAPTYEKQVTAAGFQLKGSGWYVTDFRDGHKAGPKKEAGQDAPAGADQPAGTAKTEAGAPAPAPVAATAPAAAPAPVAAPAPAPAPAAAPWSMESVYARVVQAQTTGFGVEAVPNKAALRIDRDELSFTVTSSRFGPAGPTVLKTVCPFGSFSGWPARTFTGPESPFG